MLEQARQIEERRRAEQAAAQAAAAAAAQARRAATATAARAGSVGPGGPGAAGFAAASSLPGPSETVYDPSFLAYPAAFDNQVQPGVPSLLGPTVEPIRPQPPGVYARGLYTKLMVDQQPNAILGAQAP